MQPRHSLILDQIKLISRTYSSYGTLALDKSLSSRNVLHRYSLTFAAESGDPQSVERSCPVEVMRMMVQAQYGEGERRLRGVNDMSDSCLEFEDVEECENMSGRW